MQNNDLMKKQSGILIFDNQFKWKYVGKCVILFLYHVVEEVAVLAFCLWGIPFLLSLVFHEEFVFAANVNYFLIWFTIVFIGIDFLMYALISLPRMSTGIYRINDEYLQVKEKILGLNLVDMYIPISALTSVRLKKERRGKSRHYPYEILEIEASGITYNLHCLAYQKDLYEHLKKAIENHNA